MGCIDGFSEEFGRIRYSRKGRRGRCETGGVVRERCDIGHLGFYRIIGGSVWGYIKVSLVTLRSSKPLACLFLDLTFMVFRYFYFGSTFAITEIDGVRIVSSDVSDLVQKVPSMSLSPPHFHLLTSSPCYSVLRINFPTRINICLCDSL